MIGIDLASTRHLAQRARDRLPKIDDADIRRVTRKPLLNRLNTRLRRRRRGIEIGLADAEIEHVLAGRLAALGLIADGDGFGGLQVLNVERKLDLACRVPDEMSYGVMGERSVPKGAMSTAPADGVGRRFRRQ